MPCSRTVVAARTYRRRHLPAVQLAPLPLPACFRFAFFSGGGVFRNTFTVPEESA